MIGGNKIIMSDQIQCGADDAPLFVGEVAPREHVEAVVLGGVLDATRSLGRRLAAARAELVVRGERLLAVTAGVAFPRERRTGVLDDAGLLEDGVVVLLAGDVLVGLPHVGVDLPHHAVLDLRSGIALATHPRDSGVPEVVGIDRLLDAGFLRSGPDLLAYGRRGEGAIGLAEVVAVARQLVEEGDVVPIRARVDLVQVGPKDGLRVDERVVHDVRALQADGVGVRSERRSLSLEVDVADAQRHHQGEADARVREELDHGDVAEVVGGASQRADVLGGQHIVRRDGVVGGWEEIVVLGPLVVDAVDVDGLQKPTDDELRVPDRGVAHPGVLTPAVGFRVPEIVDERVEILFGERVQRLVETLRGDAEVLEVLAERRLLDAPVEFLHRLLDIRLVALGKLIELLQLPLELLVIPLWIVEGRHTHPQNGESYQTEAWKNRLFGSLSTGISAVSGRPEGGSGWIYTPGSRNCCADRTVHAAGESHAAIATAGGGGA